MDGNAWKPRPQRNPKQCGISGEDLGFPVWVRLVPFVRAQACASNRPAPPSRQPGRAAPIRPPKIVRETGPAIGRPAQKCGECKTFVRKLRGERPKCPLNQAEKSESRRNPRLNATSLIGTADPVSISRQ